MINQEEWANAENWSGPKLLSVYFSKKDGRTWVPKQIPELGCTINLGTTAGVFWMFGTFGGIILLIIIISAIIMASNT